MFGISQMHLICFSFLLSGFGSNVSHTFHVHGYNVRITGRGSFGKPISRDEIVSLDRDGKIQRNAKNPVQKDTFVVPNKGYVILHLYTDNLGERRILVSVERTKTSHKARRSRRRNNDSFFRILVMGSEKHGYVSPITRSWDAILNESGARPKLATRTNRFSQLR